MLAATVRRGTASGRDLVEMECLGHLALLACLRGELSLAAALASRRSGSAERSGVEPTEQSATAHVALAWVALARGDLDVGRRPRHAGQHVGFLAGDPVSRSLLSLVTARHQVARGHAAAARDRARPGPRRRSDRPTRGSAGCSAEKRSGSAAAGTPTTSRRGGRVRRGRLRGTGAVSAEAHVPPVEPALPAELVEALTPKEYEVLGHLAALLTTEEIAAAMFVSVNTVRTHVRSILRKLGVSRRNAAVRRARELNLLVA